MRKRIVYVTLTVLIVIAAVVFLLRNTGQRSGVLGGPVAVFHKTNSPNSTPPTGSQSPSKESHHGSHHSADPTHATHSTTTGSSLNSAVNPQQAELSPAAGAAQGDKAEDGGLSEEERAIQAIRCKVRGKITRDGRPAAGVKILLHDAFEAGEFTSTISDGQGTFRFDGLGHGTYVVTAQQKQAFAKGTLARCDAEEKEIPVELEILKAGVRVTGTVNDHDGNPLAGAQLSIGCQDHPKDIRSKSLLPVPPDGRYEIWVPDGDLEYLVTAYAPGHQAELGTVPKNQSEVVLDFRLTRLNVVRGEVVGPKGLVVGIKVRARHQHPDGTAGSFFDMSDARGRFEIEFGDGKITLSAWSPSEGWAFKPLPPHRAGEDVERVLLELKPGRTITGTMRLQDGSRVPMAEVHFYCDAASFSGTVQADNQGDFAITQLPPGLVIHACPWHDKRPFTGRYTEIPPEQSTVELVLHPLEE